ncbi:hypothetical protein RND71_015813 [Anisodus tanguticus]|uniref:Uncharacterized protein n=1 Tax=Anisodus tanguticus TaxID=243964 RepID=A0AAE1S6K4_9SOLA|nr:hypothetical protein RND71_015813 [Anisodus tanguticus]
MEKVNLEFWRPTVLIQTTNISLSAATLCGAIGASDVPIEPLEDFIERLDYKSICETLCGPRSLATWAHFDGSNKYKSMLMSSFIKPTRVWLRLINQRIMPLDHYTEVSKKRVSMVYFFMTGNHVNVGH